MKKSQILQSPNDHRHYASFTLDNGLRLLLVEQHDAEKSAAALAINVGHFDDPIDREGLAHFLEHLVYLGSREFPTPGSYAQFISNHGGSFNAWTGTEHSCFYFDIEHAMLNQALHRFADMFSAPLFSSESIDKERQAIDAEFLMKLKDDGRRIYQAHKESINPAHPFAKFSVGNLETLADRPEQSAQQAVQSFYQQQYSSHRMTLVLVAPLPIAEQLTLCEQYFSALPDHLPAKMPLQMPLYLAEHLGIQLNIQPHKPTQRYVVSFALPDIQPWYRYKLVSFLAHLLGDEGKGSLLSLLKQRGWVNGLSAGGGIDGSNYKDFTLAFDLTPLGMVHLDDILVESFAYIALLKAQPFPMTLFAERQKIVQWSFSYQEQKPPLQLASDLAINLQHYPVEDYIFGDYRMECPPTELYQQLLSYFAVSNMRCMLIAPEVSVERHARWYQTPYSQSTLPTELLQRLQNVTPSVDCCLPSENPYLMADLALIPANSHQIIPLQWVNTADRILWFKPDTEFHSPKAHCFLQFTLPNTAQNLSQLACTKLWLELFLDAINEQFYQASNAGLHYNLFVQQHGLTLHTSGLAGNQLKLLQDLLAKFLTTEFAPERFAELQRQLLQHWHNQAKNKPVSRLFNQLSALLQPLNPEAAQLAKHLEPMTFADFNQFKQTMFQQVHVESLLIGNWATEDANTLDQGLQQWLAELNSPGKQLSKYSLNTAGLGPVWLHSPAEAEDHALVIYLPAQDRSARSMALFMLINHMISPEYFHALRTEQQLGYLVGTGYVPMNLRPGLAFYIQSPHAQSSDLYAATVIFYRKFLEELPDLTAEEFQAFKSTLALQIHEKDTSLNARAKRIWLALGQQDYQCALASEIEHQLAVLTLADFTQFCYHLLSPEYDSIVLATGDIPAHAQHSPHTALSLRDLLQSLQ